MSSPDAASVRVRLDIPRVQGVKRPLRPGLIGGRDVPADLAWPVRQRTVITRLRRIANTVGLLPVRTLGAVFVTIPRAGGIVASRLGQM